MAENMVDAVLRIQRDTLEAAAAIAENIKGSPWHTNTAREAARRIRHLAEALANSLPPKRGV